MNIKTLKTIGNIFLLVAGFRVVLPAQGALQVWPGDVNNNGVVNGVDVLWWSIAQDEKGSRRAKEDSAWAAAAVQPWPGSFPGGLNYAYADCDGNGIVNEADLRVITANFNKTRPGGNPDIFTLGAIGQDPRLDLFSSRKNVRKGTTLDVEVRLGDPGIPVEKFFGITFTIPYNPQVNKKNPKGAGFELAQESWMGRRSSEVKEFVYNDAEAGETTIAIYRKKKEEVDSEEATGKIGVYSIIVVEDIVSGIEAVDLNLVEVKMVDQRLREMPVSIDTVSVPLEKLSTGTDPSAEVQRRLRVFPNPAGDQVTVEWTGTGGRLETIEVYNAFGQLLQRLNVQGDLRRQIGLDTYPSGLYLLRIQTSEGATTRTVTKEE